MLLDAFVARVGTAHTTAYLGTMTERKHEVLTPVTHRNELGRPGARNTLAHEQRPIVQVAEQLSCRPPELIALMLVG
jgi:hypothetical protein